MKNESIKNETEETEMKRILTVLTMLALLLGPAGSYAEEPVKITFWHCVSDAAGETLKEYTAAFEQENGIAVETVFQGTYSDAVTKMNGIIASGKPDTLPDVMQLDATGKVSYLACPIAYTASDAMRAHPGDSLSDFLPPALRNWTLSGVTLGFPFATSTTVTYYNKTVLDQYGAEAPDTLDDIAKLREIIPEEYTVYAAVPNTPTLANWLGQMGSDLVNCRNGSEGEADALACIENGALETFLTRWQELYRSGALVNANSSTDAFCAGKQLIMTSSTSSIASVLAKVGGSFTVGVSAYPRVSDESGYGATVSGSCLVLFDHGEARREAALALVKYLTGAEVQVDFAMKTGYIPAVLSAEESPVWQDFIRERPQYEAGQKQLAVTPDTMCSVTVGPAADFYYAIMNDISEMLDQDMPPQETAQIMREDLEGMLQQYLKANP